MQPTTCCRGDRRTSTTQQPTCHTQPAAGQMQPAGGKMQQARCERLTGCRVQHATSALQRCTRGAAHSSAARATCHTEPCTIATCKNVHLAPCTVRPDARAQAGGDEPARRVRPRVAAVLDGPARPPLLQRVRPPARTVEYSRYPSAHPLRVPCGIRSVRVRSYHSPSLKEDCRGPDDFTDL